MNNLFSEVSVQEICSFLLCCSSFLLCSLHVNFNEGELFVFFPLVSGFIVLSKKFCLPQDHEDIVEDFIFMEEAFFSSRNFIILVVKLGACFTQFGVQIVVNVKVHFFPDIYQLPQPHLLKRLLFAN